jgi:hypothetical protein
VNFYSESAWIQPLGNGGHGRPARAYDPGTMTTFLKLFGNTLRFNLRPTKNRRIGMADQNIGDGANINTS